MNKTVFSCQQGEGTLCLNELNGLDLGLTFNRWAHAGAVVMAHSCTFEQLSAHLKTRLCLFTRHIFPHMLTVTDDVTDALRLFCDTVPVGSAFSVQLPAGAPESAVALKNTLLERLTAEGYAYVVQNPTWVLSMLPTDDGILCGISKTADNLSAWPSGMRRFAMRPDTISRAEFKLLELFELYPIAGGKAALDLGAAPGGWTKVLRQAGMTVTAVDPAQLSDDVLAMNNVTHERKTAEVFLSEASKDAPLFDLLVNDMRMDAFESASLTTQFEPLLTADATIVMTLKLPKKKQMAAIQKSLAHLRTVYDVVFGKQLFHNRSEVTIVCKKILSRA